LSQRSGRRVARVGKLLLALFLLLAIHGLKVALEHQHFAAHFEKIRQIAAFEPQRDGTQRTQIGADILAGKAITPGRAQGENALVVGETDGKTVELGLRGVFDRPGNPEAFAHAPVESLDFGLAERIVERQHGRRMRDLREYLGRHCANAPGRGIRRRQPGILFFECLQFAEQPVVFRVR
jgi:hypothetical protein